MPAVSNDAFSGVTATVHYPWENARYTAERKQNYGGKLTWKATGSVSLTYDPNGGEAPPAAEVHEYGEVITLSLEIPTLNDRVFVGWALSADANEGTWQPGEEFTLEGNVVFYAVWNALCAVAL